MKVVAATVPACTSVGDSGWKPVSATITPGHSYTLSLTNRDESHAADPTYALFDDVSSQ